MRIAYATAGTIDQPIERTIDAVAKAGYGGIEFRTEGPAGSSLTAEPCLMSGEKLRDLLEDAGISAVSLASNIRYDAPVFPPVLGRAIGDFEKPVRQTKQLVLAAAAMECPGVRVFGYELLEGEARKGGTRRIQQRLDLAVRTARHTSVSVMLENGGSFPTAANLKEIIESVGLTDLVSCYNPAIAAQAGEDPGEGFALLADDLRVVRFSDLKDGKPCALGEGDHDIPNLVRTLAANGYQGWIVNEYLGPALGAAPQDAAAMQRDAERLLGWYAEARPAIGSTRKPGASAA